MRSSVQSLRESLLFASVLRLKVTGEIRVVSLNLPNGAGMGLAVVR